MSAAHVNGRKRRRGNDPFTLQHGLTLLMHASSETLRGLLVAATRSFEQPLLQQPESSSQPSLPQLPANGHSHGDSDGSSGGGGGSGNSRRRNAAEVDEEDWHNGQQQQQSSDDTDSPTVPNSRRANHSTDQHHDAFAPPILSLTVAPAALPRVKVEPVTSSKPLSVSVRRNGTSKKKRRVGVGDSATTVDERDGKAMSAMKRAKREASSSPAAKRSLYATES